MYIIVKVDGWMRQQICTDGKPDKYGEPKLFKTEREAWKWVSKNSYKGMSFKYEIRRIEDVV